MIFIHFHSLNKLDIATFSAQIDQFFPSNFVRLSSRAAIFTFSSTYHDVTDVQKYWKKMVKGELNQFDTFQNKPNIYYGSSIHLL